MRCVGVPFALRRLLALTNLFLCPGPQDAALLKSKLSEVEQERQQAGLLSTLGRTPTCSEKVTEGVRVSCSRWVGVVFVGGWVGGCLLPWVGGCLWVDG